eukprot:4280-Heterococcus_DN1.PRE.1
MLAARLTQMSSARSVLQSTRVKLRIQSLSSRPGQRPPPPTAGPGGRPLPGTSPLPGSVPPAKPVVSAAAVGQSASKSSGSGIGPGLIIVALGAPVALVVSYAKVPAVRTFFDDKDLHMPAAVHDLYKKVGWDVPEPTAGAGHKGNLPGINIPSHESTSSTSSSSKAHSVKVVHPSSSSSSSSESAKAASDAKLAAEAAAAGKRAGPVAATTDKSKLARTSAPSSSKPVVKVTDAKPASSSTPSQLADSAASKAGQTATAVSDKAKTAAATASDRAKSAASTVSDKAKEGAAQVKSGAAAAVQSAAPSDSTSSTTSSSSTQTAAKEQLDKAETAAEQHKKQAAAAAAAKAEKVKVDLEKEHEAAAAAAEHSPQQQHHASKATADSATHTKTEQASKAVALPSSASADVGNDVSDTSSKPSAQELKAHKLRLDTLTLASEDIAEASAALKKDLEQGILGDLDQLDAPALRFRIVQLAAEMQDRIKWEALRLQQSLKAAEEEAARRYIPLITQQKEEAEAQSKHQLNEVKHQLEAQKDEMRAAIAQEYSGKVQEVSIIHGTTTTATLLAPVTAAIAASFAVVIGAASACVRWAHAVRALAVSRSCRYDVHMLQASLELVLAILHQQGQQFEEVMKERLDEQLQAVTSQFNQELDERLTKAKQAATAESEQRQAMLNKMKAQVQHSDAVSQRHNVTLLHPSVAPLLCTTRICTEGLGEPARARAGQCSSSQAHSSITCSGTAAGQQRPCRASAVTAAVTAQSIKQQQQQQQQH